jgi:hypothetical protein
MTPQQILTELTDAIVKAVPEIVSTRYIEGCQAAIKDCGVKNVNGEYLCVYCRKWRGPDRHEEFLRPITLEDVLRAIEEFASDKIMHYWTLNEWFYMKEGEIAVPWHLSLPLHQQSEETLLFLHSILCKQ